LGWSVTFWDQKITWDATRALFSFDLSVFFV
jgi:hypothetical protein